MREYKIIRIVNKLVLSIQYARLIEEIYDTQNYNQNIVINNTKNIIEQIDNSLKNKKIKHNEEFIKKAQNIINFIEDNYKEKDYKLYNTEKFDYYLKILSNSNYFEMRKHEIAIIIILDNSLKYENTDDFLERLSIKLFNDKEKIFKLKNESQKIISKIHDNANNQKDSIFSFISTTFNAIKTKPILVFFSKFKLFKFLKIFNFTSLSFITLPALVIGSQKGLKHFKLKRKIKSITTINPNEFKSSLYTITNCIFKSKEIFNKFEFSEYLISKMIVVNILRNSIANDLFVNKKEIDKNTDNLNLLYGFDKLIIDEIYKTDKL